MMLVAVVQLFVVQSHASIQDQTFGEPVVEVIASFSSKPQVPVSMVVRPDCMPAVLKTQPTPEKPLDVVTGVPVSEALVSGSILKYVGFDCSASQKMFHRESAVPNVAQVAALTVAELARLSIERLPVEAVVWMNVAATPPRFPAVWVVVSDSSAMPIQKSLALSDVTCPEVQAALGLVAVVGTAVPPPLF